MTYREILERFTSRVPATRAIIFCDYEGEAIEFISEFDSYHTQLFGAYQSELMLTIRTAVRMRDVGQLEGMMLHTSSGTISLWPIGQQYYVAVMCKMPLPASHPAITEVCRLLEAEV